MNYMFNDLYKGEYLGARVRSGAVEEGEQVSLAEELPAIHARNRAER